MSRPKVSVYIAASLDGYIAGPGDELDWLDRAAGLAGEEGSTEDYGFAEFFASIDTLVLGRRTYEVVTGMDVDWPYAEKRVYILSSRAGASRHNEVFHPGPIPRLLDDIAAAGGRHVYADGGRVIDSFLRAQAVDEMTISLMPVLLGAGIPLFHPGQGERPLECLEAHRYPTGVVQLRYRPASEKGA